VGRLIVNADDFGLTAGVNRAVAELHNAGVLTSATLMARAGATSEAVNLALLTPTLGVGCHIVLADGEPVLAPREIPTLVDQKTGRFPQTLSAFLSRLFTGRIATEEIEAEATAQIDLLKSQGLKLTHVDSHKHTHMFPAVLRPVLRAARAAGIRAVRNPFEPAWAVHATAGAKLARCFEVSLLRKMESYCRNIIAQAGFATTEGTIAVVGTGVMTAATVRSLLSAMPGGTWELVTHPGYNDADLAKVRTRLRASRDAERQALLAIGEFPQIELTSFGGLEDSSAVPA
jgi:hopanoid biosynthesis associated protein HpnK